MHVAGTVYVESPDAIPDATLGVVVYAVVVPAVVAFDPHDGTDRP